jgi:serine/threonine-protein kinase RsbW
MRVPMRSDHSYGSQREQFTVNELRQIRDMVALAGTRVGCGGPATEDLVAAVNEVVVNAVVHAGGSGSITIAQSPDGVHVTVRDSGPGLPADLVWGRPVPDSLGGRGLWLARSLCRRFTVSSSAGGVTVRLFMPVGLGAT